MKNRQPRFASLRFGFGMFIVQLFPAMAVLTGKYKLLAHWDSYWYRSILTHGYISTIPPVAQKLDLANVAFFPGYPLLAHAVRTLFGMEDAVLALVVAAHLACLAFWVYFHKLLTELKFTANEVLGAGAFFALMPGAMFLIVGYSEALFLASACGFFYWCAKGLEKPGYFALAALHGAMLTGTRYFGVVIAVLPLVPLALEPARLPARWREVLRAGGAYAASLLGILGFFAYCHFKFGIWNLYFQTVAIGWSGHFSFGHMAANLLDPRLYLGSLAIAADFPDETGRFFMLGTAMWTGGLLRHFWKQDRFRRVPAWIAGSLVLATGLFALTFLAASGARWVGMTRYLLPVQFLLLPATVLWFRGVRPSTWDNARLRYGLILAAFVLYSIQVRFLLRFTSGWWVA